MSKSILGLLLILLFTLPSKAEQPIFTISEISASPGETVEIDFHVDNFTNIISAQFSIGWDASVLDFISVKNLNPNVSGLSLTNFNLTIADQGKFAFQWFEAGLNPVTLPDGSLFFTVEFEVIGDPCESSTIAFTNDPTEIEVAEENDVRVDLVSNVGSVEIPGTGCTEGIQLIGNSVIGPCGGNTCIQFTVENFVSVVGMEFILTYNPLVLEFDRFQNFAPLPGFNEGSSVNLLSPGNIKILWTNSNVENDTLDDGTILFEICFDVIGTGGQSSEITFDNTPPPLFFNSDLEMYDVSIVPAVITAQCALDGFALIAENECVEPNQEVCIDISVNDFEDIIAMQFSINWNPALFHFVRVEGFNLVDLDASAFAAPPDVDEGQLAVLWFPSNTEGVTIPDMTRIFTLCLQAVGNAGSSSPITFSNDPTNIEVATEDSILVLALLHGIADIKLNCDTVGTCDISYVLTPQSPDCQGEATGSLNLEVDAGTCTPTFLWNTNPPFSGEDLINVPAGTYIVTITVGTEVVVASGTIVDADPIEVMRTITDPNPAGASNGSINITVSGGTPPYTFQWNTNPVITTEDLTNIPAGTYIVTITDANGCTFVPDPYIVGADVTAVVLDVACAGNCTGSINISGSFGTPPYTYLWSNNLTTPVINNLCAGIYCVTITDSGGSTRDTCFEIEQPNPLVVTASLAHDPDSNGVGAIDLNVTGGINPITYQWSTPPGSTTSDIINLAAGEYCVTITYNIVCTFDTCFTILGDGIGLNLIATQYGNFQTSCNDVCDGEITSSVSGGTLPITYLWSNNATTPDLTNVCPGIYALTVTDASGSTASASRVITAPSALTFATLLTEPTDFTSSDGAITVIPNGGVPPYNFQWTGPVSGNTASINNLPVGTYHIVISDDNGCDIDTNVALFPDGECYLASRIITPNDDGKNDYFIITCIQSVDNHLSIFNRNGGLVFDTDDYLNTWTGFDNDEEMLPDGGYLWVLEYTDLSGANQILKGTVNLLRSAD